MKIIYLHFNSENLSELNRLVEIECSNAIRIYCFAHKQTDIERRIENAFARIRNFS